MLGAIVGDVLGSAFEHDSTKSTEVPLLRTTSRFTDDTVLTVATAHALLTGTSYEDSYRAWALRYPNAGYGGTFRRWMHDPGMGPYGSFGNGSAMRVSPIAWARATAEDILQEAERSAVVTHDHPEGIKGAQAVALAIFRARTGAEKGAIRTELVRRFGYDLSRRVADIRASYAFDVTCQGSVPEAILCFLESRDFESAVRLAVSLGGDADTQAAIAGSIAEAYYGGVPEDLAEIVRGMLPEDILEVVDAFAEKARRGRGGSSMNDPAASPRIEEEGEDEPEEEVEDGTVVCPFCGAGVAVTAAESCPHLLCWGGEEWYEFAVRDWDFQDRLRELYSAADEALETAEERMDPALREEADRMVYHTGMGTWREDPSLAVEGWSTDGMLGGVWEAYFHSDPAAFAQQVFQQAAERMERFRNAAKSTS